MFSVFDIFVFLSCLIEGRPAVGLLGLTTSGAMPPAWQIGEGRNPEGFCNLLSGSVIQDQAGPKRKASLSMNAKVCHEGQAVSLLGPRTVDPK